MTPNPVAAIDVLDLVAPVVVALALALHGFAVLAASVGKTDLADGATLQAAAADECVFPED